MILDNIVYVGSLRKRPSGVLLGVLVGGQGVIIENRDRNRYIFENIDMILSIVDRCEGVPVHRNTHLYIGF